MMISIQLRVRSHFCILSFVNPKIHQNTLFLQRTGVYIAMPMDGSCFAFPGFPGNICRSDLNIALCVDVELFIKCIPIQKHVKMREIVQYASLCFPYMIDNSCPNHPFLKIHG
eukprot:795756_1